MLAVLREPDPRAPRPEPQPGLTDVPRLISRVGEAGVRVTLTVEGAVRKLPAGLELAAYRVVQEALTNAFRHAPGTVVAVQCRRNRDDLVVTVRNDAPSAVRFPRPPTGSGLGLVGMRERVVSVGGTLETGATSEGGFVVRAILPVRGDGTGGLR
jgi:signal transduction histidine kinase